MEPVTKEHNLDTETLTLSESRLPLAAGAGSSQQADTNKAGAGAGAGNSSFNSHDRAAKTSKDSSMDMPSGDHSAGTMDHGGSSVGSISSSPSEPCGDTGKSRVSLSSGAGLPSKEEQLKQFRAQCIVFIAFRNGLMPKKRHLEIALGNMYSKQDETRVDRKGKVQAVDDPSSVAEVPRSLERPDSSKAHPSVLVSISSQESDFADERISRPAEN